MNVPNFKQEARQFVIDNGCANSCPLELVEKAMEHGAKVMAQSATERLGKSLEDLIELRRRNNASNNI